MRCLIGIVIMEGRMQAPEVNGAGVELDRTFKSLRADWE
jgi:hypothetical protein